MANKDRSYNGVGINDVDEVYYKTDSGYKAKDFYQAWRNILSRCYSDSYITKHPTYLYTVVCDEWLLLSNFKKWYEENYVEGFVLDKDILSESFKVYSPETCAYIPDELNQMFKTFPKSKSGLPRGVFKNGKYYTARLRKISGNSVALGNFKTVEEASKAFNNARVTRLKEILDKYGNLDIRIKHKIKGNYCAYTII